MNANTARRQRRNALRPNSSEMEALRDFSLICQMDSMGVEISGIHGNLHCGHNNNSNNDDHNNYNDSNDAMDIDNPQPLPPPPTTAQLDLSVSGSGRLNNTGSATLPRRSLRIQLQQRDADNAMSDNGR